MRTRIWKGPTARSILRSPRTKRDCGCCSGSSHFPAGFRATRHRRRPGSIHEGGELGYSLSHAFGAAFDNPELIIACVVGDGEAETGPLATAWHSNVFLNPATDGAVLPILHLNGYKIANPTVLARIPRPRLEQLLRGYGWVPHFIEGDDPRTMHQLMVQAVDRVVADIREIQHAARTRGFSRDADVADDRPRDAKGMDWPQGRRWSADRGHLSRSPGAALGSRRSNPAHRALLEEWLKSYRPEELFDANGTFRREIAALAPTADRRMGANPHANGGLRLRALRVPDYRRYAVDVKAPGQGDAEDTRVLGRFLRDVIVVNREQRNFRLFGPDETVSNRLQAVFEATGRQWEGRTRAR